MTPPSSLLLLQLLHLLLLLQLDFATDGCYVRRWRYIPSSPYISAPYTFFSCCTLARSFARYPSTPAHVRRTTFRSPFCSIPAMQFRTPRCPIQALHPALLLLAGTAHTTIATYSLVQPTTTVCMNVTNCTLAHSLPARLAWPARYMVFVTAALTLSHTRWCSAGHSTPCRWPHSHAWDKWIRP